MTDVNLSEDPGGQETVRRHIAEIERDTALDIAAQESLNRKVTETQAADDRIAAMQNAAAAREISTENDLLRNSLSAEREASASHAFGFYLMAGILIALLIIGSIAYYYRQDLVSARSGTSNITVNSAPPPPVYQGPGTTQSGASPGR